MAMMEPSTGRYRAGVGEGHDEVAVVVALGVPHTAGPDQTNDAQGDQNDNGQQQIQHGGVLGTLFVVVGASKGRSGVVNRSSLT